MFHSSDRAGIASWEEDGGRAASSRSALMFPGKPEGREDDGCERKGDKGCAQCGSSEEDDGRVDRPEIDDVAVRQRTGADEFDCVMKDDESDDGGTRMIVSASLAVGRAVELSRR